MVNFGSAARTTAVIPAPATYTNLSLSSIRATYQRLERYVVSEYKRLNPSDAPPPLTPDIVGRVGGAR